MSIPPNKRGGLTWRWFAAVPLALLLPKCLLCVLAWVALGFGASAPEICGPVERTSGPALWLAGCGAAALLGAGIVVAKKCRGVSGKDASVR